MKRMIARSFGRCMRIALAAVLCASVARIARAASPGPELNGVADVHAHLMSHLGFGGRLFHGAPEGPLQQALPWCTSDHGAGGVALSPELGHLVGGWPEFDAWPRFTTLVHQQAHVDWIKRAYEGGLRLVTMLAVNNELLPAILSKTPGSFGPTLSTDDKSTIDRQLEAMKQIAAHNASWMEIAYSPADARRIIGQNKLAVILGTEVEAIGNWKTPAALPSDLNQARAGIRGELERLYAEGVRQMTPVHLTDNFFGGAAIYNKMFDVMNSFNTGHFYDVETAPASSMIRYRLNDDGKMVLGRDSAGDILSSWIMGPIKNAIIGTIDPRTAAGMLTRDAVTGAIPGGHRNRMGLTEYGRICVEEMMRLGILLDIDHMGEKTTDGVLAIAEANNYPVMCSHTGFRELALPGDDGMKTATEGNHTPATIERVRRLGGFVAVILDQGNVAQFGNKVADDCAGSSKSWAQSYQYAVAHMQGRGVGIGSDINGLAGLPAPRFGPYAAAYLPAYQGDKRKQQAAAQRNGVRYADPIKDWRNYRFEEGAIYDDLERDMWRAIAAFKAGQNPWRGGVRDLGGRPENLAKGLCAANDGQLLRPGILTGDAPWEQRAAFLVKTGQQPGPDANRDPQKAREIFAKIKPIWDRWSAMESGPNAPLPRSTAGNRDFDYNIDGMAHYGLLRDFLVDLRNVGLSEADLSPLYHSAEHYVQMWEKADPKPLIATMSPGTVTLKGQTKERLVGKPTDPKEIVTSTASGTVSLTVQAKDALTGQPVSAEVSVDGAPAGRTNQAFSYTFKLSKTGNSPSWRKPPITVWSKGYKTAPVPYDLQVSMPDEELAAPPAKDPPFKTPPVLKTLKVAMNPGTITIQTRTRLIGKPGDQKEVTTGAATVSITIQALDAATNQPVNAEIRVGNQVVGRANQAFTYTFSVNLTEGQTAYNKPQFRVVLVGYTDAVVPYNVELAGNL